MITIADSGQVLLSCPFGLPKSLTLASSQNGGLRVTSYKAAGFPESDWTKAGQKLLSFLQSLRNMRTLLPLH